LHLSNVLIAPLGLEAFNDYQRLLRAVYQHPVFEIGIIAAPLLAHGVAGIWLRILHRRRGLRPRRNLHFWAGAFLVLFVPGHILAVRGTSLFYGIYPEFEGLSFSLAFLPLWFYPYYFLLAMAGLYHGSNGVASMLVRNGMLSDRRKLVLPLLLLGGIGIVISLMSLGGLLFGIPDPMDNDYARFYLRLLSWQ